MKSPYVLNILSKVDKFLYFKGNSFLSVLLSSGDTEALLNIVSSVSGDKSNREINVVLASNSTCKIAKWYMTRE